MGAYKNKGSLIYQVKSRFRELDATGKKKATDPNNEYIHSFGTMKTYLKHGLDFATYCRKKIRLQNNRRMSPVCKGIYRKWRL